MLLLSSEGYVKRAHAQCVEVAVCIVAFVEDYLLQTDVRSANSDVAAIDRH
jgi:hypothetical protein